MDLPLGQGFYKDTPTSAKECVNFEPDTPQTQTYTGSTVEGSPGIESVASAAADEVNRGGWDLNGKPYEVNGTRLYRIDRTFDANQKAVYSAVEVGTGLSGTEQVILSDNGTQLMIVIPELDEQFNAWVYTEADGLIQVSDASFQGPVSSVDYIDGLFGFVKKDSDVIFISEIDDGLTYDATDSETVRIDPDPNVGQFVLNNQWYIAGTRTITPFLNIGGADFPFVSIPEGVLDKGFSSQFCVVEMDGSMVFLGKGKGEQPAIWSTDGGQFQKLSNTAMDKAISKFSDSVIDKAFSLKVGTEGKYKVYFTFPDEITFVYYQEVGIWGTLESVKDGQISPYRVQSIVEGYGEFFAGDLFSENIGILDNDLGTEFGDIMRRRVVLDSIYNEGQPFFLDALQLVIQSGTADLGTTVTAWLSLSYDGGQTFDMPIELSLGLTGDTQHKVIWTQLGQSESTITPKIEVSGSNKMKFIKCDAWLN